jgi:hypothetical protein
MKIVCQKINQRGSYCLRKANDKCPPPLNVTHNEELTFEDRSHSEPSSSFPYLRCRKRRKQITLQTRTGENKLGLSHFHPKENDDEEMRDRQLISQQNERIVKQSKTEQSKTEEPPKLKLTEKKNKSFRKFFRCQ